MQVEQCQRKVIINCLPVIQHFIVIAEGIGIAPAQIKQNASINIDCLPVRAVIELQARHIGLNHFFIQRGLLVRITLKTV